MGYERLNLKNGEKLRAEHLAHMEEALEILSRGNEVTEVVAAAGDYTITGFIRPGGTFGTQTGYRRTDYIRISGYTSLTVCCQSNSDSVAPVAWFDGEKNFLSGITAETKTEYTFTVEVPAGAEFAIFSSDSTNKNRGVSGSRPAAEDAGAAICYISPTGDDGQDGGTAENPVQTLSRAKEILSGEGELVFLTGIYENLDFDLSDFAKVSAVGDVKLVYYAAKVTEAAKVAGYQRVYAAPYGGSYSKDLWQFDVPDANTAISDGERHPLQRGRSHRLEHTRIYPATKLCGTDLALAGYLEAMEADHTRWMYYMDGETCYFTVPEGDLAEHPLIVPGSTVLKASRERKVQISGVKIYFASLQTGKLTGVLEDVTVGYHTKNGAIMWDNTFGLTLSRCEAVAGSNDGINGHTAGAVTCVDCWGHDCSDDGESAHEECHIIQHGGLYEYNGNGCTPASGASGAYIGTVCRNNGAWDWVSDPAGTGFSAQSTSTTAPATMHCLGCQTSGCKIGYRQTSASKATFVSCVSMNDVTPFGAGQQINCAAFDDAHPGYGAEEWVFELEDGTVETKLVVTK